MRRSASGLVRHLEAERAKEVVRLKTTVEPLHMHSAREAGRDEIDEVSHPVLVVTELDRVRRNGVVDREVQPALVGLAESAPAVDTVMAALCEYRQPVPMPTRPIPPGWAPRRVRPPPR